MAGWLATSFSATSMLQKSDNLRWALFLSFAAFPTVCNILRTPWVRDNKRSYLVKREVLDPRSFESVANKATPISMTPTERVNYWINKDPANYYLQEVLGEKALTWVKQRNHHALEHLGDPTDTPLYKKILSILDSKEKIPYFTKIHDLIYNFWQDDEHPRGILRRTTLQEYQSSLTPAWETVLDIDALGKLENESWVYKGYVPLEQPKSNEPPAPSRILLYLSRGGSDATIVREFDLLNNAFVVDRPFHIPIEAKTRVAWKDIDTLWIGTNLDTTDSLTPVKSMTSSGYPRVVREWKRGDRLTASTTQVLFEGEESDVSVSGNVYIHGEYTYAFYRRSLTFYTEQTSFQLLSIPSHSRSHSPMAPFLHQWFTLPLPEDIDVTVFQDHFLLQLRSDWQLNYDSKKFTYSAGSLLAVPIASLLSAIPSNTTNNSHDTNNNSNSNITCLPDVTVLFAPSKTTSLDSFTKTKDFLIVTSLDSVKTRLSFWQLQNSSVCSSWRCIGEEPQAEIRGVSVSALDRHSNNAYLLTTSSFVKPTQLWLADAEEGVSGVTHAQLLRSLTKQFDGYEDNSNNEDALCEFQYEAVSLDGTKIPYFVIAPKGLQCHGLNPTLLYGYGGFEISLTPSYASILGATWLNREMMFQDNDNNENSKERRSTVYVVANIRGGGEFGPTWHQAALKEKRHVAYEDFIAVAEDLIRKNITQREYLAIRGGSNGGLLVGNVMTMRPDLFAAVCCAVPLLDMRVYHTLLAGASWQAEYGNPDIPEDWVFLQQYSAYHQIDPLLLLGKSQDAKNEPPVLKYPALLMTTSTRDDRVHPYHARCFVKRLIDPDNINNNEEEQEKTKEMLSRKIHKGNVLYYENMEGGHGGAADNKQQAFMNALYIEFLRRVIIMDK